MGESLSFLPRGDAKAREPVCRLTVTLITDARLLRDKGDEEKRREKTWRAIGTNPRSTAFDTVEERGVQYRRTVYSEKPWQESFDGIAINPPIARFANDSYNTFVGGFLRVES